MSGYFDSSGIWHVDLMPNIGNSSVFVPLQNVDNFALLSMINNLANQVNLLQEEVRNLREELEKKK